MHLVFERHESRIVVYPLNRLLSMPLDSPWDFNRRTKKTTVKVWLGANKGRCVVVIRQVAAYQQVATSPITINGFGKTGICPA